MNMTQVYVVCFVRREEAAVCPQHLTRSQPTRAKPTVDAQASEAEVVKCVDEPRESANRSARINCAVGCLPHTCTAIVFLHKPCIVESCAALSLATTKRAPSE